MFVRQRLIGLFALGVVLSISIHCQNVRADQTIHSTASGTGSFSPVSGYYFGPGTDPDFGDLIFNGTLVLEEVGPTAPGKFTFENAGRGSDEKIYQETIYADGSTISTRFSGEVQLIPVFDDAGNQTDQFTAQWDGQWDIVRGTGKFRGATGQFTVSATNDPFRLTDANWNFSWNWAGDIQLPKKNKHRPRPVILRLSTQGRGIFDPANIGQGDPAVFGFPAIIGDGSGEGIYDGTPRGLLRLNGRHFGPDQHFGTAQSNGPGLVSPAGTYWYPGQSGANPDGSGRKIHKQKTLLGEIWYEYRYFFELDLAAGVITGRADFRVVGGTWLFWRSKGSVFVLVRSELANVTGLPSEPVAPFDFDFRGHVELLSGH